MVSLSDEKRNDFLSLSYRERLNEPDFYGAQTKSMNGFDLDNFYNH